jgi:hypothetical protein
MRMTMIGIALLVCGCGPEETPEDVNPSARGTTPQELTSCGVPLASFQGTTAFSNGANTGTGLSCAGSGPTGLRYQCAELVMRHFQTTWGFRWFGNAKDLLRNAPAATVAVRANGDAAHPPVPGDMLVWTNGTWGHVALVVAVRPNAVDLIEQNVIGNGRVTLPYDGKRVGARWNTWVPAGWAHALANAPPAPIQWSCADSAFSGRQLWTCRGAERFRCTNGVPEKEACLQTCASRPLGTDDVCQ